MAEYLTHQTIQGDRWDLLAYHYYGDAMNMGPLLVANPSWASMSILPAGLRLQVPILAEADVTTQVISGSVPWL